MKFRIKYRAKYAIWTHYRFVSLKGMGIYITYAQCLGRLL